MILRSYQKYLPPFLYKILNFFVSFSSRIFSSPVKRSKMIRKKSPKPQKVKWVVPKAPFDFKKISSIFIAFFLAAIGQWEWSRVSDGKTLWWGLLFYSLAVILFLFTLKPWNYESLQRTPLSPRVEAVLFGFVMVVAAFFRLYKLDTIPNGIFMDQGFEGLGGLRIAHEGWRPPLFLDQPLYAPSYILYVLALWFKVFQPSQFNLYLFFASLALAAFPLIYWTFRQLTGPRVALLSLFLLAVMRWHVNFSRNGFPTIEIPFYMFGTLAFLLYGYRSEKRWPFYVSAVFLSLGLYTYQAFKIFPLLLIAYGVYEFLADRKKFFKNIRPIVIFVIIFFVLASPIFFHMIQTRSFGSREDSNNIWSQVRSEHSFKPVVHMITKTLLMCNREGDDNERHNVPNRRMLDDISGVLFVLGVFYALFRIRRRKYFYAISGLMVMSLPCLLSVVPAHANRMLGVTAFVCFLIATPVATLWGRVRQRWGALGEAAFLLLLVEPLLLIAYQNYDIYFNVQPKDGGYWNSSFWGGYSYDASVIGKAVAQSGDAYEYYLDARHSAHDTVKFLTFNERDHVHHLDIPAAFAPLQVDPKRGLFFGFLAEQEGYLQMIQSFYPHLQVERGKNQNGQTLLYMVKVPASDVAQGKGLKARYLDGRTEIVQGFPETLPPGPYQATFTGSLYLDQTAFYEFDVKTNGHCSWSIGGHPILPGLSFRFLKGFYRVNIQLEAPPGTVQLELTARSKTGKIVSLDNAHFTAFDMARGLKAAYFDDNSVTTVPVLEEWDPFVDFYADFPYNNWKESALWKGQLKAFKAGNYQFVARTDELAKVVVDGKVVVPWGRNSSGSVFLEEGFHQFLVHFQKELGPNLVLYWKTPGAKDLAVVPNSAFGWTE